MRKLVARNVPCTFCGNTCNKYEGRVTKCVNCARKITLAKFNKNPRSEECKKNMSISKLGSKNPMWRGDNVGYAALHEWVNIRKEKPTLCECCKKTPPIDLANISGKYLRDLNDWEYLCRRCHMVKDGRAAKLGEAGKKYNQEKARNKALFHPIDHAIKNDVTTCHHKWHELAGSLKSGPNSESSSTR